MLQLSSAGEDEGAGGGSGGSSRGGSGWAATLDTLMGSDGASGAANPAGDDNAPCEDPRNESAGGGGSGGAAHGAASHHRMLGGAGGAGDAAPVALQQLAAALAFAHRLDSSPYARLLDTAALTRRLSRRFEAEAFGLVDLPPRSALQTCVAAGSLSLPRLAKLATVLKGKYITMYKGGAALPLDLDLPPDLTFHSTFTCPISKELATPGNPPMLLPCGHVLAFGSVTKLARGSRSARFKCPYCPCECTTAAAQALTI